MIYNEYVDPPSCHCQRFFCYHNAARGAVCHYGQPLVGTEWVNQTVPLAL